MNDPKPKLTLDQIKARSAQTRRHTTVMFWALAVLVLLERFGWVGTEIIHWGGFNAEVWRVLAYRTVMATPDVFYLLALWWIRQAMAAFAEGALYTPTLTRMLERMGLMLAIGACIAVFVVPGLSRLLGFDPGYFIAFDVSAMVLGCIGVTLRVLADVLRRAAELQTELDEMF
jgi:hypothetical protein